jgi:hypothetical protein
METSAEAVADALVTQLSRGDTDPTRLVDGLRASRRPYYTWALAWAQWTGVLERHPGHKTARRAVTVLRSVEPAANRLDMVCARGQRDTPNPGSHGDTPNPGSAEVAGSGEETAR